MPKRKINETTVREWYADYKDMIHTYLVYLTLSFEVDSLVSQSVIQAAKISASKRTSRIHPHVLILSAARFSIKKRHRKKSSQVLLDSLRTEHASGDAFTWIDAVLSLPDKEREVFVLREVLGLDSRQTSQIVKYTSVKVEDRLAGACRSLHEQLNNEYTKQLLRKLDTNPDSLYESILPAHIRKLIELHSPAKHDGGNTIEASYRQWLKFRTRRRLLITSSSTAAVLLVGGLAANAYKPWVYFLSPSSPSTNTVQLRREYTKNLGFIPRLPSEVPKGYHLLGTSLQKGNGPDTKNELIYSATFWTGQSQQPSTINIIESGKQVDNVFNRSGNNNDTITVNRVQVKLNTNQQTKLITAYFHVDGTSYTILTYHGNQLKHDVTKQQMIDMVRSMIIHPKVLTRPIGYTYDNLSTMQEIQTNLNFTPVLLTSLPDNLTTGPNQSHGFVATHQKQKYGTFTIDYTTPNRMATVNLMESKGSVTEPTGQQEGSVFHPLPSDKTAFILGQKVYLNTQPNRLFWKSKWTGVVFQLNLQSQQLFSNQPKINLKQIAKQLITADKRHSGN